MYYTDWSKYPFCTTVWTSQVVNTEEDCAIQRIMNEEAKKPPEFRQTVFYISCHCRKCRPYC